MGVAAVLAAALFGLHPAQTHGSCAAGFVPARINGHFQCLHEGQSCKRKLDRAYQRYHFRCLGRYLTFDWKFLRRPFHVPDVAPGSPCPMTQRGGSLDFGVPGIPAFGPGPAYPTALGEGPSAVLGYFDIQGTDWGGTKALWLIAPGYHRQMLIRGRQLDGPNGVRFEDGVPGFTAAQVLNPRTELRIGWGSDHPAVTRLRAPGCYAYQIDGLRFSYDIVFEARSLGPAPHA